MKIVFAGTPDFSVPPLKKMVQAGFQVEAVFTQPDRGVGRGRKIQFSPVKEYALSQDIPVFQPKSLKPKKNHEILKEVQPDLMIVVAYGLILPQIVLDIPKHGCWNIHASLLPRWRGAAPIHRAMLAGDKTTGVGIMQMEAGLDTGPVFVEHKCNIADTDTLPELHDRLSLMGASALVECLELLQQRLLPAAMVQDSSMATYAHKLEKSESLIDWNESAEVIERKVRGLNPWPGVKAKIDGIHFKLWKVKKKPENSQNKPGDIVLANKSQLIIQCGEGQLEILSIQKPGKNKLRIEQFMPSQTHWYK